MQRFTISLEEKLAADFDSWIAERGYSNRSEAVRDLLRAELGRTSIQAEKSGYCIASLSYVFNHGERELSERLAGIQHGHHDLTVSAMHVHLDHEHCMETLILRGATEAVTHLADAICAERGVHHGKLNLIGVDAHAPHRHGTEQGESPPGIPPHLHFRPSH
jgi:CopG family nickel-responsive transcriptional regulator